ncbi:hypothetical protein [Thioclava sp.]|uniref:hypothetical protein n=1 Tax=Thioclava sp. TaxID=1933450 RepID=UPI003AA922A2
MIRLICLCLLLAGPALAQARAEGLARPQGLLWSDTALPRTLPLQVKTAEGRDYYLVLRDVATGRDVIGAYAQGGAFFRLLVPPGRFELQIASGQEADWQGRGGLFGAQTQRFALEPPLDFGVTGYARKGGHLVDLRNLGAIAQTSLGICQRLLLDPESVSVTPDAPMPGVSPRDPMEIPDLPVPRYREVSRICD